MNSETIPFEESLFLNQNAKFILSILNEDIKSSSWLLTNGIHKIGRLNDKEIILDDVTVSRNHAYISVDDDTLLIYDENSTNGIFVNGELIKKANLYSGTRIQIGKYFLIVSSLDES
jgi:pSer/pThr/pTyr-binding forkhead associated (FHA) protein